MQLTLHFRITAGVAIAGASIIAVTPVTGPLLDIQVSVVQLSAARTDLFGTVDNTVVALLNAIGVGRTLH